MVVIRPLVSRLPRIVTGFDTRTCADGAVAGDDEERFGSTGFVGGCRKEKWPSRTTVSARSTAV
jgi:hypothetical protein